MSICFQIISGHCPNNSFPYSAFLIENNWDDYGFKSTFYLTVFDGNKKKHDIGTVKIGYIDQNEGWTKEKIHYSFDRLGTGFFSLGQEAEYYENIKKLPELEKDLLISLCDIANDSKLLESVIEESVFKLSLLRTVSLSAIHNQYKRILSGEAVLTEFSFSYKQQETEYNSEIKLDFDVKPNSKPSTNIHILIGRNGVGKTTLLNNMVSSIINSSKKIGDVSGFYDKSSSSLWTKSSNIISKDYFSSVVSVSFSAFDHFIPPPNQPDRSKGTCYFYIGLKNISTEDNKRDNKLKDRAELCEEFIESLDACLSLKNKKERWLKAIKKLKSDMIFADMDLSGLVFLKEHNIIYSTDRSCAFKGEAKARFEKMSSGHAIVLLSITKLIETVEEKTLVLIDEPESHLHPPLLSAFIRALSDLLISRNGVAIIASHSPVVLQEVPKSCVWILRRNGSVVRAERPENETFGENVGVLTREVFGLEVSKSGFCELLQNSVAEGKSYEDILTEYTNQLGFEGKAILRALITRRDTQGS